MANDPARERLITLARDLYLESGPERFSLRELARRAGVSAAALYRHFDDKDDILREVCHAGFQTFASYLLQALSAPTPRARLDDAAARYLRFALDNPRDYRVIFMGETPIARLAPGPAKGEPGRAGDPTFRFLVDRVRECMQARVLRRTDAVQTATMIWAHVHGLVSLRLSGHFADLGDDRAFTRFYRRSVEHLLAGL